MKKVLAILLSVAMLACFATTAFAAETAVFSITAPEYAKAGDTIEVAVALASGDFSAGTLLVKYDAEKLTPKKAITKGTLASAADAATGNVAAEPGVASYAMAFTFPTSEYKEDAADWGLFVLKFTINEGVADGTELDFVLEADGEIQLADDEGNNSPIEVETGAAKTIVGEKPADPVDPPVDGGDDNTGDDNTGDDNTGDDNTTDEPTTDKPAEDKPATDKPATDKPATSNPKTGDAGVAVFAGIVVAAAAAAFVASKKNA